MTIIRSTEELEAMQARGEISTGDADEIRRFMEFLRDAPPHSERKTAEGRKETREAYLRHYPEYGPRCARPKWHSLPCGEVLPEDADALRDKPQYLCGSLISDSSE